MTASRPKTICIVYGFCEGPRVSKKFQAALKAAGYTITNDVANADTILTHSGGAFLLPEKFRARHIIHIGIPFWPDRWLLDSINRKFWSDLHRHHREGELHFWLKKTSWNLVYIWNFVANTRMLLGRARGRLWRHGAITTVVRPSLDTFCTPNLELMPFTKPAKMVAVPGHHDDCWRQPAPYIAILEGTYE